MRYQGEEEEKRDNPLPSGKEGSPRCSIRSEEFTKRNYKSTISSWKR